MIRDPQLDRGRCLSQTGLMGEEADRVGDYECLDARFVCRTVIRYIVVAYLFAHEELFGAWKLRRAKVRDCSCQNQAGVTATRETKESNPPRVDLYGFLRGIYQESDGTLDIDGADQERRKIVDCLSGRRNGILRVIESDDGKAGVRQKFGGVVVTEHVSIHSMRDQDERQILAQWGAILHASDGQRSAAAVYLDRSRRDGTRRPQARRNLRPHCISRNDDLSHACGSRRECEQQADRQQNLMEFLAVHVASLGRLL
jgi:hypothetical protein